MFRKRHPPAGAPPGTLAAAPEAAPTHLLLVDYTPQSVQERAITDLNELPPDPQPDGVRWLSVQGLGSPELLTAVGGLEASGRRLGQAEVAVEAVHRLDGRHAERDGSQPMQGQGGLLALRARRCRARR